MADTSQDLLSQDRGVDQEPRPRGRGRIGRPRKDAAEPRMVSEETARRLVAQAREDGLDIAGESGLLQQLMKAALN